jgi:hypothetical protein
MAWYLVKHGDSFGTLNVCDKYWFITRILNWRFSVVWGIFDVRDVLGAGFTAVFR